MLGVEAHSLLPHNQHDGGNLSCQGQSGHFWPHAFGQQSRVELLQRTGFAGGDDRRPLEQILQIVIAIAVESANRVFLGSLELSIDGTMIGTATCLDGQTCASPKLRSTFEINKMQKRLCNMLHGPCGSRNGPGRGFR